MSDIPHETINVSEAGVATLSAPTHATQGFIDGSGIFSVYLEMAGKEDKKWSKVGKRLQMGSLYSCVSIQAKIGAMSRAPRKTNVMETGIGLGTGPTPVGAESEMVSEEDKKMSEGWKADADGVIIICASPYRKGGNPDAANLLSQQRLTSSITFAKDAGAAGFVAILQPPLGDTPVSRSARRTAQRCHAGNGQISPSLRAGSISDLDVHALKRAAATVPPPHPIRAGAFALRVQALIADNCALMECLIRFAQARDLLKKNAEHAQKLAQDSNAALETYQRQVPTLEEQLAMSDGLQEQVDHWQLAVEKPAVEERAAEQAEALHQLTEAKAVQFARALQLAEDPAPAQGELRVVNTVSEREQMQRLALLDEINLLRALGKL
ncbi:hypothetical protein EDB83DRAFT_2681103 [Lactarius deliciosus]|nr:hypothetical protein EDB83DRAFT_2681103 [Lactarius deliciosus]